MAVAEEEVVVVVAAADDTAITVSCFLTFPQTPSWVQDGPEGVFIFTVAYSEEGRTGAVEVSDGQEMGMGDGYRVGLGCWGVGVRSGGNFISWQA